MKIATYSRVSRNDGTQDAGNQADELRAWAQRLGGTIVAESSTRPAARRAPSSDLGSRQRSPS